MRMTIYYVAAAALVTYSTTTASPYIDYYSDEDYDFYEQHPVGGDKCLEGIESMVN